MRTPRTRRSLLSSVLPVTAALAGCFDGQLARTDDDDAELVSPDEYDCGDRDRPDPEEPVAGEALERVSYPTAPESVSDDAETYALEFEQAYRQNAFLEEYGSEAHDVHFDLERNRMTEIEGNPDVESDAEMETEAVVVSIVYDYTTATSQGSNPTERGTRVTYYIDENVTIRARNQGIADEPEFEPDPRGETGTVVACSE
ncbi:hypothetical protein [Natronorubrum daqingense]|uniref:Uncharacterized protein n=1 Tax=Natronorubrum daqingense TaxID=588898 RepID=A0A1N7FTV4_9EURY|nr:hypothetical protein [Natronorubrum daqingense]APX97417.1 hypothetical protein BB347_12800 [Natronorubrum daqingense]SIS03687.1 hypothetical protein SAMN05421809_3499 [Natronorubrum daqingense]